MLSAQPVTATSSVVSAAGTGSCEFPGLRTPATLKRASSIGVTARVICSEDSNARLKLKLTKVDAEYFHLRSRTIGTGSGNLAAGETGDVVAFLRLGSVEKLSRIRGETVYFKATVTAKTAYDGAGVPKLVRFGDFTVGR
jgi:hypothetical protein